VALGTGAVAGPTVRRVGQKVDTLSVATLPTFETGNHSVTIEDVWDLEDTEPFFADSTLFAVSIDLAELRLGVELASRHSGEPQGAQQDDELSGP